MQPLPLRDIHQPPAPPWWPPAPGWWLLAIAGMVLVVVAVWAGRRARQARLRAARLFDDTVAAAPTPAARVAAMSELLRRAARRRDPAADRLRDADWLGFLDGAPPAAKSEPDPHDGARAFRDGPGRLLLDGGFRPDVDPAAVDALLPLARARYLELMRGRR